MKHWARKVIKTQEPRTGHYERTAAVASTHLKAEIILFINTSRRLYPTEEVSIKVKDLFVYIISPSFTSTARARRSVSSSSSSFSVSRSSSREVFEKKMKSPADSHVRVIVPKNAFKNEGVGSRFISLISTKAASLPVKPDDIRGKVTGEHLTWYNWKVIGFIYVLL